jgi:uncharacterized protein (TIGR02466 family)
MSATGSGQQSMHKEKLPVVAARVPDCENLNSDLRKHLLTMSNTIPDRVSNQQNGISYFDNKWLSESLLHKSENTGLQSLLRFAQQTANRMFQFPDPELVVSVTSMWSMVSKAGLAGVRHNHAGRVSGAYYVDAGSSGETDGGLIEFYQQPENTIPSHRFQPESGQLLLFPSSLEHSVSSYQGASPRIVISLNLS